MIGLLDTHVLMWADSDSSKLSANVVAFLQSPANRFLVSTASLWEIVIKVQSGKLTLRAPVEDIVADQRTINGIKLLPISFDHVLALDHLPIIHKDSFDRMLVAQAKVEGAVLLTSDPVFNQYPVRVLW